MSSDYENPKRKNDEESTWSEEVEVAGKDLVEYVKKLVEQGNVRRLIIRKSDDSILLEIPLTQAVVVGGITAVLLPVLTALGTIAAVVAKVKIEIVRELGNDYVEDETTSTGKRKTRISIETDD